MAVNKNLTELYNCFTLKELTVLYKKYNAAAKELRINFNLKKAKTDWDTYSTIQNKLNAIIKVIKFKFKENNV